MTQDEIIRMAREAGFSEAIQLQCVNKFERFAALVAAHEREKQEEQEPVAQVVKSCKTFNVYEAIVDTGNKLLAADTKLYAAPVRTKDLTDDEIAALWASDGFYRTPTDFARAVIAADREKNR